MTSSPQPVHHRQINTTTGVEGSPTTNSTSGTTPWSCETNWTVTRGSLNSAVTFESFDFPIDSESTGRKPPLLLVPPSTSDFEPCEIKLNFTQKHEIRQVYVKSTARVYEIYYASDSQSENEYLCTVRCSAASVDENLIPETDVKDANSANLEGQNGILPKGRMAGENNEDDWVEIKLPVGQVDEGNSYSPNTIRNYQNYYEATAEMNDLEPCKSLTLRLLSLQSKAFVHVDEVYVFADCINTDDSQNQTVSQETSAGSSLMTMLVPTLLGLSKSRSLQLPDQHSVEKPFQNESRPAPELTRYPMPPSTSTSTSDKDKVCDLTSRNAELTRSQGPTSDAHKIPYEPNTPLLEQLISRVTRIEDILLRFEEKMLKPINNIDARLHHVEQQLESLTKISHFPKSPSEPKPEYSNQLSAHSESENQLDTSVPITTQSPFSEKKQEPPTIEKPKKSVSIDDALAAALAGFSSVTKPDNSFPILQELKSNNEDCESIAPEIILQEEKSETNESQKETVIVDDSVCLQGMVDEENKNEAEIVEEESIKEDKSVTFDKNDILKYFPAECSEVKHGFECGVDFETSILEVKFSSLENASLKSNLEDFLSYADDESLLIKSPSVDESHETNITGNGLLVELDGDDVAVTDGVQQDLPDGRLEASFDSLI